MNSKLLPALSIFTRLHPSVLRSIEDFQKMKKAKEMGRGSILVNLSGRGDKDLDFVTENYGFGG